jgi:hypothetical protein
LTSLEICGILDKNNTGDFIKMIAKIIEKDRREYYSTVFALCGNGWNTVAVVFDEEQDKFSFIKMYHFTRDITRSVFIVDCDESDFEKEQNIKINLFKTLKNVRGYDWLVNDRKLFLNIINNKEVDECYKDKAKALNAKIEQNEWTFVRNEKDVENLMSVAWGFHDGIIEKITYNNDDCIEVVFSLKNSCCPGKDRPLGKIGQESDAASVVAGDPVARNEIQKPPAFLHRTAIVRAYLEKILYRKGGTVAGDGLHSVFSEDQHLVFIRAKGGDGQSTLRNGGTASLPGRGEKQATFIEKPIEASVFPRNVQLVSNASVKSAVTSGGMTKGRHVAIHSAKADGAVRTVYTDHLL